MEAVRRWWAYAVLAVLAGCAKSEAQDAARVPERIGPIVPIIRSVDSTYRNVCYVFPNGSGDCEKF